MYFKFCDFYLQEELRLHDPVVGKTCTTDET